MKNFYITTTLPYVNSDPHLGFAMEIVQADIIARYHRLIGNKVIFNTGTDEHGVKIYRAALKQNKDPQDYVDEYAAKFDSLKQALNLSYTNFIRTSSLHHKKAAQEFWRRCLKKGDIYKQNYKIKYCIGCELEKTESELVEGRCPIHPNLEIEIIEEENYFFRFSKYQKLLLDLYNKDPEFVVPDFRFKEIKEFVSSGLQDFSISRLKEKLPWGIDVPDDPKHVLYVWFDALVNYISTLGWPDEEELFKEFWPGVQIAGKDNLRQQAAMWQAMLMSAGLPKSKQIIIHGFITNNGQKMSKSLGNVIDPFDLVRKYGTEAVRFFIAHELNTFEDSDVTLERIHESYNAYLANGLGNTVSRLAKLAETSGLEFAGEESKNIDNIYSKEEHEALKNYEFNISLHNILVIGLQIIDQHINQEKPWLIKDRNKLDAILREDIRELRNLALKLQPFLPETAQKILDQFSGKITVKPPLFPRIN